MTMGTMAVKSVVLVSVTTVAALFLLNVSLVRSQHMFRSPRGKHGYSNKKMLVSPGNDPQVSCILAQRCIPLLAGSFFTSTLTGVFLFRKLAFSWLLYFNLDLTTTVQLQYRYRIVERRKRLFRNVQYWLSRGPSNDFVTLTQQFPV